MTETTPEKEAEDMNIAQTAQPQEPHIEWPSPGPDIMAVPGFNAIWDAIKKWDINVPNAYVGYCGATGNHVVAILSALREAGFALYDTKTHVAVPREAFCDMAPRCHIDPDHGWRASTRCTETSSHCCIARDLLAAAESDDGK